MREITLEEISAATKISIRLLKALEAERLSRPPAPAFTRGFIRSYSAFTSESTRKKKSTRT